LRLVDYPLYDEDDHGHLIVELADEMWDAYLRLDIAAMLRDEHGIDLDDRDIGDDGLRDLFFRIHGDRFGDEYAETATSVVFPSLDKTRRRGGRTAAHPQLTQYRPTLIPARGNRRLGVPAPDRGRHPAPTVPPSLTPRREPTVTTSTVPPMPEDTPPVTVRTDTAIRSSTSTPGIGARVSAPHPHRTATLRDLVGVAPFRGRSHPRIAWADLAVAWCVARGYHVADSAPLWHDSPRLSEPFAVVPATARRAGAIAVVSVNDDPPTVYATPRPTRATGTTRPPSPFPVPQGIHGPGTVTGRSSTPAVSASTRPGSAPR